jgi:ADP-ribose pyrophosphatase
MSHDIINEEILRYFEISKQFPEQFKKTDALRIIADKEKMLDFHIKTGRALGIVYESSYHLIVVDLMINDKGEYFTYLRILNPNGCQNGVVMIPFCNNKIALLRQFRHGTREWEWELPRGFPERNLASEETAIKEIREELGADVISIEHEGVIVSDSALNGCPVDLFSVSVEGIGKLAAEEGISSFKWVTLHEVKKMIVSNEIRDAFTICAISKYIMNREGKGRVY